MSPLLIFCYIFLSYLHIFFPSLPSIKGSVAEQIQDRRPLSELIGSQSSSDTGISCHNACMHQTDGSFNLNFPISSIAKLSFAPSPCGTQLLLTALIGGYLCQFSALTEVENAESSDASALLVECLGPNTSSTALEKVLAFARNMFHV